VASKPEFKIIPARAEAPAMTDTIATQKAAMVRKFIICSAGVKTRLYSMFTAIIMPVWIELQK
jgi:hypothetical protein